jgi:hypothetical protein
VAAFGGLNKFKMVAIAMVTKMEKMLNSLQTSIANQNGRHMEQHVLLPVNIHFH